MFIDIKKRNIYFFDSVGDLPPKQIFQFVDNVMKQGENLKIKFKYNMNHPVEHQEKNTECGMYCLYLIITLLLNQHSIEDFKNEKFPDDYMEKYRQIYFNKT